jgi:hypothetical protein
MPLANCQRCKRPSPGAAHPVRAAMIHSVSPSSDVRIFPWMKEIGRSVGRKLEKLSARVEGSGSSYS